MSRSFVYRGRRHLFAIDQLNRAYLAPSVRIPTIYDVRLNDSHRLLDNSRVLSVLPETTTCAMLDNHGDTIRVMLDDRYVVHMDKLKPSITIGSTTFLHKYDEPIHRLYADDQSQIAVGLPIGHQLDRIQPVVEINTYV